MLGLGIFITAIELTALAIIATVKHNAVVVRNYYEIISKANHFSILLGFVLLLMSVIWRQLMLILGFCNIKIKRFAYVNLLMFMFTV